MTTLESFLSELEAVATTAALRELRSKYLGKKGVLTEQLKTLPSLDPHHRAVFGASINETKKYIEERLKEHEKQLTSKEIKAKLSKEKIDITLPGYYKKPGGRHPVTIILAEITDIFVSMGFSIEEGPEVESDYYNFEALNIPQNHPARDMQDTFYIDSNVGSNRSGDDAFVLRTHTSPVQIRVMKNSSPPLRFIAPGKVYRCDSDISHSPMFHQIEGLVVDKDISFANLKGLLEGFLRKVFGPDVPVRLRPSFFPFTEPSAEVDMGCYFCKGSGCRVCKGTGWIEIMGAGMVDPRVFNNVGYDTNQYSGFAFGMGIERIASLKYGIDDIRLYYEGDLRFLRQF
ncbi:MAG: phenylalanine--tRNA ligase subunit alpha [Candidatus Magnetominusculus sp. LBB02]|nr:phenylalanine--tRNA ligase subunit alpha [Candidatus Magnetominusculus sp. LBB02]